MNSRINIRYSTIYDTQCKMHWEASPSKQGTYPTPDKINRLLLKRTSTWRKLEAGIVKRLEDIFDVRLEEACITAYVVGRSIPFSDPLTLPIFINHKSSRFVDTLTHELIHILLSSKAAQKRHASGWKRLEKMFQKEPWNVMLHVVIHAGHALLLKEMFGNRRLREEMNYVASIPEYSRAWNLVSEYGAQNIIITFTGNKKTRR